ncbi:MAG: type IV pilus assembly protein PilM [Nitrospirae bacterium]|nr:type IV pilus assembly protein PilM [Nitrospirota bacterium]
MFFRKKSEIIGLDIGSSSIKVIQIEDEDGQFRLSKFGMCSLEPEMIVDGTIMDSVRCVEALQGLLKEQAITAKDAVISLSGHAVIVKRVSLPQMTEDELAESIKWEAEQYIPFDINDVDIDFQILNSFVDPDGKPQIDVLLAAVKKDKLTEYTSLVIEAGLKPVIVDIDSFALENMYEINYAGKGERKEAETVALINIGASITNINILQKGMFAFMRDVSIGGNRYTESIQKELGLSYEDAEKAKRGENVEGADSFAVDTIIENVSTEIVSEITRSFGYFKTSSGSENIDKLMLSGGSSRMKNLNTFLQEHLGIPIEQVNPFKHINIPAEMDSNFIAEAAPLAAVAVGLGIRRLNDR